MRGEASFDIFRGVTEERPLTEEEAKTLLSLVTQHFKKDTRPNQAYGKGRALAWAILASGNQSLTPDELLDWTKQQMS